MLCHACDKVNARRFDARMPENIRQLDDVLVRAVKRRREQVAEVVRETFPAFTPAQAHSFFIFDQI